MRAVLVTAHADDEALWFGGLLYRTRYAVDWHVLCCSVPSNRPPEHEAAWPASCRTLGATPLYIAPVFTKHAVPDWPQLPDLSDYDLILTHGSAGEYGHAQHAALSAHLRVLYRDRVVATSGYGVDVTERARSFVQCSASEWAAKEAALRCYAYDEGGGPKWRRLLDRYDRFNLRVEPYDGLPALAERAA